jgi:hypothetical protein
MSIKIDLIDGDGIKVTRQGREFTRSAKVYNLPTDIAGIDRKILALEELREQHGIVIGQNYPAWPGAIVTSIAQTRTDSTDIMEFGIVYREEFAIVPVISISSNATEVETNKGKPLTRLNDTFNLGAEEAMTVEYTYPDDYFDSGYASKTIPTGILTSKLTPEPTVTITRNIRTTHGVLREEANKYVGKVNDQDWSLYGVVMGGTGAWKCTDISGSTIETNANVYKLTEPRWYAVSLTFQGRAEGWSTLQVFIDPNTGRPPSDAEDQEGAIKEYVVEDLISFNDILFLQDSIEIG